MDRVPWWSLGNDGRAYDVQDRIAVAGTRPGLTAQGLGGHEAKLSKITERGSNHLPGVFCAICNNVDAARRLDTVTADSLRLAGQKTATIVGVLAYVGWVTTTCYVSACKLSMGTGE